MGALDKIRAKAEELAATAKPKAEELRERAKPAAESLKEKAERAGKTLKAKATEVGEGFKHGSGSDEPAAPTEGPVTEHPAAESHGTEGPTST
jgi:hypothetical protein